MDQVVWDGLIILAMMDLLPIGNKEMDDAVGV
jgi:hypothetical protein